MPQLHINNSFKEQQEKSYSKQVAKGLALLKQAVSENSTATHGTVGQSFRLGLASSVGLGGAYVAASKLTSKIKKFSQGIKALTTFNPSSDNVEEENVFSKSEQTKQPGFFGIAGLAKYGFKHLVRALKFKKKSDEKDKKKFFQTLFKNLKHLFQNKWFLGTLLTSILGVGLWSLVSTILKKDTSTDTLKAENAQNMSFVDDPDFLADAQEQQIYNEFQEILNSVASIDQTYLQTKWQKDIEQLQKEEFKPQPYYSSSFRQFRQSDILSNTPISTTPQMSLPVVDQTALNQVALKKSPLPNGSYKISSGFGYRDISAQNKNASHYHKGIDLAAAKGTPVIVPAKGKVISSGFAPVSGNWVKVQHENGYQTVYLHLDKRNVVAGQELFGGEQLGTVGNTGSASTGAHLHFGVKKYNPTTGAYEFVNPEPYMRDKTQLSSTSPVLVEKTSSNSKNDMLLTDMVIESRQQLLSLYDAFDQALIYHIQNPDEKFKKLVKKK